MTTEGGRGRSRKDCPGSAVSVPLRRSDITPLLGNLPQPVLIVTGAEHAGFTPDQARAAARILQHGQVAVVAGTAYLVPLEDPDTVARLVSDFWAVHHTAATS